MKKLFGAAVLAVMFVGSAFAIDFSVDANFAVPFNFTSSTTNIDYNEKNYIHTKSVIKEMGLGADVGLKAMLTRTFGLKVDLGLYFPQSATTTTTTKSAVGGAVTTTEPKDSSVKYSDLYDSYTSFNLFAGPAIRFKKSSAYDLCVTPGFSVDVRKSTVGSGDSATSDKLTYLGFGAELDARYNINKNFYVSAACPLIYQFKVIDANNKEYEAHGLYIVPKIGVGYRF